MGFEQILGIPKMELSEKQKQLVEKLRDLDKGGKDPLIQKIIKSVELGYADAAKTLCRNEADKFRSQPEVIEVLKTYLFDESEQMPWISRKK